MDHHYLWARGQGHAYYKVIIHSLIQQNWVPKWQVLLLGSEDTKEHKTPAVSAVCLIYDAGHGVVMCEPKG